MPTKTNALKIPELAALLSKAGIRTQPAIIEKELRRMLEAGAPMNRDETVDIVKFTAYLVGRKNGKIQ